MADHLGSTDGSLEELFTKNKVPLDVLKLLAVAPYNVLTVKQYANYFDERKEIKTLFFDKMKELEGKGDILANLKMAWREAEATVSRSLKRASDGLAEAALEDPLQQEVKSSLDKNFLAGYGFTLMPAWAGYPSLLGRFQSFGLLIFQLAYFAGEINRLQI